MRKLTLVFALLALVACQEVVVQNWSGQYDTGTQFSKTYQNADWNNFQDFAISGWFKINSSYPRSAWSNIFHFTSNDANFSDYQKAGDRCLAFFMINNNFHTPTYTYGNSNVYNDIAFDNTDTDKWAFFYVAHGSDAKRRLTYFNLAQSGAKQNVIENVVHSPSNFYRIYVGQSVQYKFFPGSLYRVTIQAGPGAYRESNFDQLQNFKPSVVPACPQLYSGCAFTGVATNLCDSNPSFDVKTIKSIFIPAGYGVSVYDTDKFAGKKVTYNQSIECITSFNWSLLVKTNAITVTDDKRNLKRHLTKQI